MSSPGVETARKAVVVSVLAGYVLEDVVEEVQAEEVEAEEAETKLVQMNVCMPIGSGSFLLSGSII